MSMRTPNIHDYETLDYFVKGSKSFLSEQVMEKSPAMFEEAARLAEHTKLKTTVCAALDL